MLIPSIRYSSTFVGGVSGLSVPRGPLAQPIVAVTINSQVAMSRAIRLMIDHFFAVAYVGREMTRMWVSG